MFFDKKKKNKAFKIEEIVSRKKTGYKIRSLFNGWDGLRNLSLGSLKTILTMCDKRCVLTAYKNTIEKTSSRYGRSQTVSKNIKQLQKSAKPSKGSQPPRVAEL